LQLRVEGGGGRTRTNTTAATVMARADEEMYRRKAAA
jgi:hypothetical protein